MMTASVCLRVALFALLVVDAYGFYSKGSKSAGQGSGGTNAAVNYAPLRPLAVPYKASSSASLPVQPLSLSQPLFQPAQGLVQAHGGPQVVQLVPASGSSAVAPAQMLVQAPGGPQVVQLVPASGSSAFAPAQMFVQAYGGPQVVQAATGSLSSGLPVAEYSTLGSPAVGQAGYEVTPPLSGAAQSTLPETQWAIAPQLFEDASADSTALGLGDISSPASLLPSGPVLQSGETSSVAKEAELGNYQHQTEEVGYPDFLKGFGQEFASLFLPHSGAGGFWGFSFPYFDYRLLYGLYPSGTYSTFSKQQEGGEDYFKDIRFSKVHAPKGRRFGKKKRFFSHAHKN